MINNINSMAISAFPAVGKSYIYDNADSMGVTVYDSDSSTFDKADFPSNYIEHIKGLIADTSHKKIILVSSHEEVRDALIDNEIHFTLVYPSKELKDEFMQRYINRGSEQAFIDMMDKNFDSFVESCDMTCGTAGTRCIKIETKNTYLSDILGE